MLKIGVIGASGRMGKEIIQQISLDSNLTLAACLVRPNSDTGYSSDVEILKEVDVIIDFSKPKATLEYARLTEKYGKDLVIGTTGFTAEEMLELKTLAKNRSIIYSANMSYGVNVLLSQVQQTAAILKDLKPDIEVLDFHHRHKVDAPSGTSLALGEAAARGLEIDFASNQILSRDQTREKRPENKIGFASLRGGNVVGEHSVIFAIDDEVIEFTHKGLNRSIYAKGAVSAAKLTAKLDNGFYYLYEVISLVASKF